MRARGRSPSSRARARGRQQHRGGAVGDLRRRARGVHAVLARDRLQLRERLERRLAQAFVAGDVMRRAGRLAVLVDVGRVDRHDLALEAALGPRPLRALLRLEAELVAVGAGDAPLVGDALGAFELRRQLVVLAVRLRWSGRPKSPRVAAPSGTRLIDSTPHDERDVDDARLRPAPPRGSSPAATSRTGCRRWSPRPRAAARR